MDTRSTILTQIINQQQTAILLINDDFSIAWCNPASEELLGLSSNKLLGSTLSKVIIEADFSISSLDQTLISGNRFHQKNTSMTLLNKDEIIADISVSGIEIEGQQKLLFEIIKTDQAHLIGLESSEYSQHLAATSLIRALGHEIKNPLGGLRGAAQLLAMEFSDPQLEEYTQVIIKEADRLSALVDRMMTPSKPGERQLVNVHELIENVLSLLKLEIGEKLYIERDYDPSLPELLVCGDQIQQALLNISQNAVQAMEGEGRLTIRTRIVGSMLLGDTIYRQVERIDIIDDGPGIPAGLKDKLFMPMISGRVGGTGLGLGIAQNLIQQHSGLIEYQDKAQRTTFTLYLPVTTELDDTKSTQRERL